MSDTILRIDLAAALLALANIALLVHLPDEKFMSQRWVTWVLLPLTAGILVVAPAGFWFGGWWYGMCLTSIALITLVLWDTHLGARRNRPGQLVYLAETLWRHRDKIRLHRPNGRPMQTIAQVRAEYGQNILTDAIRDPALNRVLDTYVREITTLIQRQDGTTEPMPLTITTVTTLANTYLDRLSNPGQQPSGPGPYRRYSHDMLTLAALCRLAEKLTTPHTTRPAATG